MSVRTENIDDQSNRQRVVFKFDSPLEHSKILTVGLQGASMIPIRVQEDILTQCQVRSSTVVLS